MLSQDQLRDVIGSTAYDVNGDKLGKVGQVFLDDQTGKPEWATVNTGLFGMSESFVPLSEARIEGGNLYVAYPKDRVSSAPNVSPDDGHLSEDEEARLYDYYGIAYSEARSESGLPGGHETADTGYSTEARDVSGPNTDDAMTRSEERLNVGTERREAGRARLRKYVVTEDAQQTVPVSREEVRVEREPITDDNVGRATSGQDISEEETEVTLHEERPVVEKEAVPVERVRLGKEQVTDEKTVSEEVRKEQIETEGAEGSRGTTGTSGI